VWLDSNTAAPACIDFACVILCTGYVQKCELGLTIYGYARVSTGSQSLASQEEQLKSAGCGNIYAEKVSGAKTDREALARLLRRLDRGDMLVVTRLDRLAQKHARSAQHP
jgi:DNA invertase Pin-like site-specific DNA recombinase